MKRVLLVVAACLLLLQGCSGRVRDAAHTVEFFAMDTVMDITVHAGSSKAAEDAAEAAVAEVYRLDKLLSIEDRTTELWRVNDNNGGELSNDALTVISKAMEIYRDTGGAFDMTVGAYIRAWGFYSREYCIPDQTELDAIAAHTGSDKLALTGNTLDLGEVTAIDLGGIAKGYASDRAAAVLQELGIASAILSLGGNVHALGSKPDGSPWNVAIRDPFDAGGVIGSVQVSDMAVITSGSYQRFFEQDGVRYHHIIDPKTGKPAQSGVASVTVVCPSGILADGLSTALFVMGLDEAIAYWRQHVGEFDFIIETDGKQLYITQGLEGIFNSQLPFEVIKL